MQFDKSRWQLLSGIEADSQPTTLNESSSPQTKKERLAEAKIRKAIREEIISEIAESRVRKEVREEIEKVMEEALASGDSDWIYRGNPSGMPKRNRTGDITLGFLGYGFKK
jgi:hypothetical protein